MLDRVPESIEPVGLADVGRSFRGEVEVSRLARLSSLLSDDSGVLKVELRFDLDERRLRVARGTIRGQLQLTCQRCMQALPHKLDLGFRLGIVRSEEEIERLPEGYEPLMATGETLNTTEVLEDEILLALPAVPLHEPGQGCEMAYENTPGPKKDNPFSVLEKLKN